MNPEHEGCLPDPHRRPRWRTAKIVVIVVLYLIAVVYAPLLLELGMPAEVVIATAPPVLALTTMLTRRVARQARPTSPAPAAA